jgi:tryptophan synthase alpha chain
MTPSVAANRIDACFERLKSQGRGALISYFAAGDPSLEATVELVVAVERAGVDIVELGAPFSDPIADGVVNQLSFQRAFAAGTTFSGVLDCVARIRERSQVPVVLYTYYNPVMRMGLETFVRRAKESGVDGVLLLDLPPDEGGAERAACEAAGIRWVTLIAPTTPAGRVGMLAEAATGFVYYVSREGVTGVRDDLAADLTERVAAIRSRAKAPVVVGFGISTPGQVRAVCALSDGAVVGSAIVRQIEQHAADPDLTGRVARFVEPLAAAAHGD